MKNLIINLLLLFKKTQIREELIDNEYFERKYIKYKKLFGKEYVISSHKILIPPKHFDCRCNVSFI